MEFAQECLFAVSLSPGNGSGVEREIHTVRGEKDPASRLQEKLEKPSEERPCPQKGSMLCNRDGRKLTGSMGRSDLVALASRRDLSGA